MVKNRELAQFSATQNMALAMLGYYRWLPRTVIATCNLGKIKPLTLPSPLAPPTNICPNQQPIHKKVEPISPPVIESITAEEKPFLLPLADTRASVNISRDYTLLTAENLPCLFLMPPLWASDERLHCFATSAEKALWLNAWQAVDLPVITDIFSAFFAAKIPIQIVPNLPLAQALAQENKPLICVGTLHGLEIPHDKVRFTLTHPWFLLQKPQTKKTFWLDLLALKEKLF